MNGMILAQKKKVFILGSYPKLEKSLKAMGSRMGFQLQKVQSEPQLIEALKTVTSTAGVIACSNQTLSLHPDVKVITVNPNNSFDHNLSQVGTFLLIEIPNRLVTLSEFAVLQIIPRLMNESFKNFSRSFNFSLKSNYLITCDGIADGFFAKASCEVNMPELRKCYPNLSSFSDHQLIDAFGEMCNQILGVINSGLRVVGLNPLISLPIVSELGEKSFIVQVDFMPIIRFIDQFEVLAMDVAVKVEPTCPVRWEELPTQQTFGDIDFFS